jgi:flagellin-like hook-associated protein FlgL
MADISLTASSRNALLSLQNTADLSERTQNRLSTGKRVSSAIDDAVSYFQSKSLSDRAADFSERKAQIDQGVSSLTAAVNATESIDKLLKQLKGIASAARGATESERTAASANFKEIGKQIAQLAKDATYQGLNLLTSTSAELKVAFSERSASQLKVEGFNLLVTGNAGNKRALFTIAKQVFSGGGAIQLSSIFSVAGGFSKMDLAATTAADATSAAKAFTQGLKTLDNAVSQLRGVTARLGTNVTVLQTRSDFSQQYQNTMQQGSDKLTLADLNTEAANMTALQTRQQLGIQSLSFANQQQQGILSLLR